MTFISTDQYSQVSSVILLLYYIGKDEPQFLPKFQGTPCLCHRLLGLHRTAVSVGERKPSPCGKYRGHFCHNFCVEQLTEVFRKEGHLNLKPEELVDIRQSMKRGGDYSRKWNGKCNLPRGRVVFFNNQKFSVVVINSELSGARWVLPRKQRKKQILLAPAGHTRMSRPYPQSNRKKGRILSKILKVWICIFRKISLEL